MANNNILTEVPPISKQDSFVVFERRKSNFNFPIHIHSECELNYIIGARGARRIVGDHVADIGDREMVLITGSNLEHAWMDGNLAPGAEIYEVTIQFSPELFQGSGLIDRKQFAPIKKMLQDAQQQVAALALLAAAKVSGHGMDTDSDRELVEDFLREAGDL